MNYEELKEFVYSVPFDVMTPIYKNDKDILSVFRPSKLSARFKNYDVNKNFQIFLQKKDEKAFRPNHLLMLIDLKLRTMEHPELQNYLLEAFDKIFYGMDPYEAITPLLKFRFSLCLNSIDVIAYLAQLFLLEQNEGFAKKSNYNPPSLYIQGWIRTFINEQKSIDDLIRRMTYRNPPPAEKYTFKDDRNHIKFDENSHYPLWYL